MMNTKRLVYRMTPSPTLGVVTCDHKSLVQEVKKMGDSYVA